MRILKYYIELLAKGTGKPKEELAKDIQRPIKISQSSRSHRLWDCRQVTKLK
ncbi:hypothetical protein NC651_004194 [Populus alba x Populus x berolinensis]|nr:hypothetical protein NC651_004194 [Populus alba x Populus x berolinensis]